MRYLVQTASSVKWAGAFLLTLFIVISSSNTAFAQCTNPAGTTGEIIYNSSYDIFQGCTGNNGWTAFHGNGVGGGSSPGGGSPTEKIVFVTSTTFTGNLGGMSGADSICTTRAAAVGLLGTFRAWISGSDSSEDPETRFTQSTVPYRLLDGTTIANDWPDLIDGTLAAPINVNELGANVASGFVFSNTLTNGTGEDLGFGGERCTTSSTAEWNADGTLDQYQAGDLTATNGTWTNVTSIQDCNVPARLYCFEQ